jgi:hypothetical protein
MRRVKPAGPPVALPLCYLAGVPERYACQWPIEPSAVTICPCRAPRFNGADCSQTGPQHQPGEIDPSTNACRPPVAGLHEAPSVVGVWPTKGLLLGRPLQRLAEPSKADAFKGPPRVPGTASSLGRTPGHFVSREAEPSGLWLRRDPRSWSALSRARTRTPRPRKTSKSSTACAESRRLQRRCCYVWRPTA